MDSDKDSVTSLTSEEAAIADQGDEKKMDFEKGEEERKGSIELDELDLPDLNTLPGSSVPLMQQSSLPMPKPKPMYDEEKQEKDVEEGIGLCALFFAFLSAFYCAF